MRNRLMIRWMFLTLTCCAILAFGLAFPVPASAANAPTANMAGQSGVYPDVIPLPDGWLPEGIAIGAGHTFYSGSRASGAIYRGDLRTGEGEVFVQSLPGRVAVGLKYDQRCNILVVAGGQTGQGYIYDGSTGQPLRVYQFSTAASFINDVVVTKDAVYLTNSSQAELYRLDLSDCSHLPTTFETIPLAGDWQQVAGFNANGIVADPSGKQLIVVNSTTGSLYRVDPATGAAAVIDLGGQTVTNGDGLLLHGQTLYVVRNQNNLIAVVRLNCDWSAGEVVGTLTSPNFDVPTTIGLFGDALYAINGRFTTPPTPTTPYSVVRVERNQ